MCIIFQISADFYNAGFCFESTLIVDKAFPEELKESQDVTNKENYKWHVELFQFESSLVHHLNGFALAIVFQHTLRCFFELLYPIILQSECMPP